nr:hypothetical protein [Paenibacillus kribbensis]
MLYHFPNKDALILAWLNNYRPALSPNLMSGQKMTCIPKEDGLVLI